MAERVIDIDHFPESEAAKRMLSYVTAHWYDKSYVGKWVYEVMGIEMDAAVAIAEDLPNQFFVDTATWGLIYHEQKYGLPMQPLNTDYAARRKLIHEKMDTKAPMTPYRMEQLIKAHIGYEAHVYDINDVGHTFSHPNIFSVQLVGDDPLDFKFALKRLRAYKQSHTRFLFSLLLMVITITEAVTPRITFRMEMPWWTLRILDGTYSLDGEIYLDQLYPTEFYVSYRIPVEHIEEIELLSILHRYTSPIDESISEKVLFRMESTLYTGFLLDGRYDLDGTHELAADIFPLFDGITYATPLETVEDIGFNLYRPSLALALDGTGLLDGEYSLNSGREEL